MPKPSSVKFIVLLNAKEDKAVYGQLDLRLDELQDVSG